MSGSLSPYALPAPAITDAAQPPSMADAWQANVKALGDWINQQRAKSAAMGLWNDQTGMPTQQALAQMGPNAALGMMGTIRAYHGSPYDFNTFDLSKIGTGEGAQAYGHGLYFAERPGVAESYRDALKWKGSDWNDPQYVAGFWTKQFGGDAGKTVSYLQRALPQQSTPEAKAAVQGAIDLVQGGNLGSDSPNPGRMYEVNINAEPQQLLDWDKPISQQSPQVKEALGKLPWADAYLKSDALTGGQIAPRTAEGSAQLKQAGIPGIQYLDQGSRAAGEGSRNYVMFDPSLVQIVRKYLAPLMAPVAASPFISQQQGQ